MITDGPEFDKFLVEPGMEIEPFDMKLSKEIFLNHPFKILLYYLRKHLPYDSYFSEVDISDLYFRLLDDYNRYGIAFEREDNLFPDNNLYVIENDNSKNQNMNYILIVNISYFLIITMIKKLYYLIK